MKYGYARVSTLDQNLDRQLNALEEEGVDKIYSEKLSGGSLERPVLNELLDVLKEGDLLIITDLTRFSRSTKDLFSLVEIIKEKKCNLKSIKDTWLDLSKDNPYSEFLLTIMGAISQLERDLTKQRQKEGIEIAKKKGLFTGRPAKYSLDHPKIKHAFELYHSGKYTVKEICGITSISEPTFYRFLKKKKELQDPPSKEYRLLSDEEVLEYGRKKLIEENQRLDIFQMNLRELSNYNNGVYQSYYDILEDVIQEHCDNSLKDFKL